jgi:hypothetical protein
VQGKGGRIHLAGDGLAAVEAGRVLWSVAGGRREYVTAFAEGELAVAVGDELRIVDSDGTIRQSFHVDKGETLSASPAIAEDGSVWIASDKALYVAR